MRIEPICAVALLALHTLWPGPSRAADPGSLQIKQELSKEEVIYRSTAVPEGYTVDRSLSDYAEMLSSGFDHTLANLGPNDRWLDIGAGQGKAILDYYMPRPDAQRAGISEWRNGRARAVAISIEDRRTPVWSKVAAGLRQNQIQYLLNRHLRQYSVQQLGRFQLITDVIGGFSYAEDLSLFVEKALGFLVVNGSFYTVLADVRSEDGGNRPYYPGSPFSTALANADGSEGSVCSWLKSIRCVEVACESKDGWHPPIEAFRLRKVCEKVAVPALKLLNYEASTPPGRQYRRLPQH